MPNQQAVPLLRAQVPQRRDGTVNLTPIPLDIYHEIFDYIQVGKEYSEKEYKAILSSLIPVCRLFRAICLPRRLQSLTISSHQPGLMNFASTEFKAPHADLHAFVRALRFVDWLPPRGSGYDPETDEHRDSEGWEPEHTWAFKGILLRLFRALPRFANVTELTLERVLISPGLFDQMANMPSLDSMIIKMCGFKDEFEGQPIFPGDLKLRTPLRSMQYEDEDCESHFIMPFGALVASPALETLITSHGHFAREIMSKMESMPRCLKTLDIACSDVACIRGFLEHTPTLETLRISKLPLNIGEFKSFFKLSKEALPNLHSLSCPFAILEELISGRPVSNVEILNSSRCIDIEEPALQGVVTTACQSSVPIRSLAVVASHFPVPDAEKVLPQLDTLTLYTHSLHAPKILSESSSHGRILHPTVQTVHIHTQVEISEPSFFPDALLHLSVQDLYFEPCYDLKEEHTSLQDYYAEAFPSATTFSFSAHIEWRKHIGEWKPVVTAPEAVRQYMISLARVRMKFKFKDWQGCLKRLFEDEEDNSPVKMFLETEAAGPWM